MKFGLYIRNAREKMGWTQPEAAEKIGIEQSYLSKLETGKSFPSEEIFSSLIDTYRINVSDMSETLGSDELERLKEISAVRKIVLNKRSVQVSDFRRWLIMGLTFMMLGGACIGVSIVEINEQQYHYRSMGVLLKGESLDAFDIVKETLGYTTTEGIAEKKFLERQLMMTNRIAQIDIVLPTSRGAGYIEEVTDGKRYFKTFLDREVQHHNRWFIVPGLMFLLGSFGCFLIGFRWK
ncbi:helix-turn-helix domain-containing protein [Psychrobium sp. nBUS_13]|uniref:helix-turn-helix domain-containing protein n=1 Tax=Psychrobium sp. nBUS_13 TaxID=3395319 RepID=UPI003EBBD355